MTKTRDYETLSTSGLVKVLTAEEKKEILESILTILRERGAEQSGKA